MTLTATRDTTLYIIRKRDDYVYLETAALGQRHVVSMLPIINEHEDLDRARGILTRMASERGLRLIGGKVW